MDCCESNEITMSDYMMLHPHCAICHWPGTRKGRRLELHHIVAGPGRKNPPDGSNWLCTCSRCHVAIHSRIPEYGELSKGAVLTAKIQEDGPLDLQALASLKHKKHLGYDPEPIPEPFLQDRIRNGGDPWP